jgi:hypothetical protein
LNLKKFPTKAYSFGLGRGEVFKTHVNEVYYKAEEGLANPGPGSYTPPPIIGKDTPQYSIVLKSSGSKSKFYAG